MRTRVRPVDKFYVGAEEYRITYSDDSRTVSQSEEDVRSLYGVQAAADGYIGLYRTKVPGRMGHTFFHELTHAIVDAYGIDEMVDENGKHIEENIDRMGLGIYLALKSMGIHIEDFLRVKPEKK